MSPNPLGEAAFKATMEGRMTDTARAETTCVDIWPYVRLVQSSACLPQPVLDNEWVEHVYHGESGRYDHVLIPTGRPDTFLVIVVDTVHGSVYGHRLLDLSAEYGLTPPGESSGHTARQS